MPKVWVFLAVLLSVLVPYARTLDAPLIWDDRHLILESAQVSEQRPLASYLSEPFWVAEGSGDSRAYFRPLTVLSFAWDHALHGENPAGYHLTNSALHALNALLLLGLLLRRGTGAIAAGLLSAAWALQPRLTEAAAWVSGRTDLLACSFCLLALHVHRPRNLLRAAASALLLLLGLFAKEVALAGVAAVLVREFTLPGSADAKGVSQPRLGAWRFALPSLAILLVYGWLRQSALAVAPSTIVLSVPGRGVALLEALGRYGFDLFIPWRPQAQQGQLGQPDLRFAALGAGLVLAAGLGWWLRSRGRAGRPQQPRVPSPSAEALALGGVSLALVLHFIPISLSVVAADRFLYLPLAALALGLGQPLTELAIRRRPALAVLLLYVVSLCVATLGRLEDWRSELRFWLTTYEVTPKTNSLPGNELGNVYYRAGLFDRALGIYQTTAKQALGSPHWVSGNLANSLSQLGRYAEARSILQRLCRERRDIAKYCLDAALLEAHELRLSEAHALAREAERRAPDYRAAADVLALLGRLEQLLASPELQASDPAVRAAAQFRLAQMAGRRPDALKLAELLLTGAGGTPGARREAVEYWVRFGPPDGLERFLLKFAQDPLLDVNLRQAAQLRQHDSRALVEAWPKLGVPLPSGSDAPSP